MDNGYLIDPDISAAKFERELAEFRQLQDAYIARGWLLVKHEFPKILVVFATPQIRPPAIAFGALIDFANYDFWAPSVRLVDPFTQVPYRGKDLPTRLVRAVPLPGVNAADLNPQAAGIAQPQPLMQFYGDDDIPFLCLPGVREYHTHPAHTGDAWFIHRAKGEGTLHFILEQLNRYGTQYLKGYLVQSKVLGLAQQEIPL